jgi:hypothetical protein
MIIARSPISSGLALLLAGALSGAPSTPATAGTIEGWWGGDWACNIDGRPANMRWIVVEGSNGLRWKGSFSDNGSQWVPLTNARFGDRGGLYFNHADGNRWYLAEPEDNVADGWTTWNGQRYPLSCWH